MLVFRATAPAEPTMSIVGSVEQTAAELIRNVAPTVPETKPEAETAGATTPISNCTIFPDRGT